MVVLKRLEVNSWRENGGLGSWGLSSIYAAVEIAIKKSVTNKRLESH